jgi:hypothetical protein
MTDDPRLQRVEELLRAAGPAPELPPSLADPPQVDAPARERRVGQRWGLALGLASAAAAAAAAFAIGYGIGTGDSVEPVAEIAMHGVGPAAGASADLEVGEADAAGNVPLEMRVEGLRALPRGGWYELFLSKGGKLGASCGTFTTDGREFTVRLSVGYDLRAWRDRDVYDGWVVTAVVPGMPGVSKRVLLTT